ncbi:MAG: anaerobic ribonucleoside-triphosphate reductase activating protein [Paramuribaculum sp.]|nr:anaerobic ribonucleoside-triphosphate reductase activating protein [Paramuribaculum sp.]
MKYTLRIHDIIEGTTVDGPGFRTSIYLAGCEHHCQGCHNPQTWDLNGGYEISVDDLIKRIIEAGMPVTLSGGDPLVQKEGVKDLCSKLQKKHFNIWLYTGYIFENLLNTPGYREILEMVDVIVDGPFIENLKDTSLLFRGSANQRLIDINKTLNGDGEIFLWQSDF